MTFTRKLLVSTFTILAMTYGAAEAAQLRGAPNDGGGGMSSLPGGGIDCDLGE